MRFDFIHGDIVRWRAGEHTNRHRDWTDAFHCPQAPPRMGFPWQLPPPAVPRAQRFATEGAPLTGEFVSHPPEIRALVA
jgi:hypothetical protein